MALPKFKRGQIEALGRTVRKVVDATSFDDFGVLCPLIIALADMIEEDNPKFQRARFLEECAPGIEGFIS